MSEPSSPGGAMFEWVRQQPPVRVGQDELAQYRLALDRLEPVGSERACKADLGLRYLFVYANDAGHIGVAVDEFGCQDVRLTDDPVRTVAGESDGFGTVSGVLQSRSGLLEELKITADGATTQPGE